jgi:serine/threonine-protein kinase RsbW/stage II sporulation protein AB (anti-sigma F factor)
MERAYALQPETPVSASLARAEERSRLAWLNRRGVAAEGRWSDVNESAELSVDHQPAEWTARVPQLKRIFPAQPDSVAAVRAALVAYARACGVADETVDAIALAASEAATNVVIHAYAETGYRGPIEVLAALAGGELWVIIADMGSGLQPRPDSPGLGLGLAIIARVADAIDLVEPASGGLEVRMRFAVDSAGAADSVDRGDERDRDVPPPPAAL